MEIKRGTRVSLNKAIRKYYFQGANGINLRADTEDTAIIPNDISDFFLEMIVKSVRSGQLMIGWAQEPKPEVKYKEDDKKLLDKNAKKIIPFLEAVSKEPGKGEDAPVARLEKLLSLEKNDKNRKTVIEKLEELLGGLSGVSAVVEDKDDVEEVQINLV